MKASVPALNEEGPQEMVPLEDGDDSLTCLLRRSNDGSSWVLTVINSDAHGTSTQGIVRWGVTTARRAGLTAADIANTRPWADFAAGAEACRRPAALIAQTSRGLRLDSGGFSAAVAQQSQVTTTIARDAADVADFAEQALVSARSVDQSLERTAKALNHANMVASKMALKVGEAEATVSSTLAALRNAS